MEKNKSAKLRTASRLVGYIGIGACLLGAFLYLLLHEVANKTLENMLGKFEIKSLIYVGILAAVFLVIAVALRVASTSAKRKEDMEAEAAAAAEAAEAEAVEEPVVEEEPEPVVDPEAEEAARKAAEKAAAMEGGKNFVAYIGKNISEKQGEVVAKVGEFTKKNAKVIVAVAATLAITNMIHKNKLERETTRRRQNFFRSLGC